MTKCKCKVTRPFLLESFSFQDALQKNILDAITKFYADHALDMNKMVMFTSDGASVMLGRHKGAAALLKRQVPHLTEQHCVAHREDLGIDDAWNPYNDRGRNATPDSILHVLQIYL